MENEECNSESSNSDTEKQLTGFYCSIHKQVSSGGVNKREAKVITNIRL